MKLSSLPLLVCLILLSLLFSLTAYAQETGATPPVISTPSVEPASPAPAETPAAPPVEAAPPAVSAPSETTPKIAAIEISGNEKISEADIRAQIKLKVGDVYDEAKAEADRTALFDMGWFARVEASTRPADGDVVLTFRVEENDIVQGVNIQGVTVAKPNREQLLALMKTKAGEVANNKLMAQDISAVENAYAAQGYMTIVTSAEMTETNIFRITVLETKIVEIRIVGNKETKTNVIQRELRSKVGDLYNTRTAQRDLEKLWALEYFEDVRARPEIGPETGTIILVIEVVEKKRTGMATFGGGWGSAGGFVGFVDVSKANWRGTGQKIGVRGQFGGVTSYEASYLNPWITKNHTSMTIFGYNRLIQREAFTGDGEDSFLYDERRTGGSITFGRPFGEFTRGYVTVRRDDVTIENIEDASQAIDDVLVKQQSVTALALRGDYDTRNIAVYPTRGARNSLVLETAGFTSGAKFNKVTTDLRRYIAIRRPAGDVMDIKTIRRTHVLALRVLAGTVSSGAPFLEQFLLGGQDTLRGYKNDRFPGEKMVVVNTEYRFPLTDTLQGTFFFDAGDAWGGDFASRFGDTSLKTHIGYGAGIQVQSPLGPIRLQYGIGDEGGQLHFGIGSTF